MVSESGYNGWLSGSQGRAWIREGGTSKLDQPGWVKPWQNANDQVLPDFTGLNENSMEDIMHDGDDLQEFSDGAAQNAAKRIKETGGWDPNILIATGEKVDMETSGRTIFDTLPEGPERTISWQLDPDDPTLPQEPPDETDPVAAGHGARPRWAYVNHCESDVGLMYGSPEKPGRCEQQAQCNLG